MLKILQTNRFILVAVAFMLIQGILNAQEEFSFLMDDNGLVSMEAEHYDELVDPEGETSWALVTEPAGASNDSAMIATPDNLFHASLEDALADAPHLVYRVKFTQFGVVYIWARANHADIDGRGDDSFHTGFNDTITATTEKITFRPEEGEVIEADKYYWINQQMTNDGAPAEFEIPSAGVYTFKAYMREGGFVLDKIVLTTNKSYVPTLLSEMGPDETLPVVVSIDPIKLEGNAVCSNFPNPFKTSTTITYSLDKAENVSLKVYDMYGKLVTALVDDFKNAGKHDFVWEIGANTKLTSGMYYLQFKTPTKTQCIKMMHME